MLKNNLFFWIEPQLSYRFIFYLLSFALKEYQTNDLSLTDCAKELVRYIMGIDATEDITVTDIFEKENIVMINETKYIFIQNGKTSLSWNLSKLKGERNNNIMEKEIAEENIYCVYYDPLEQPNPLPDILHITRKQLLQICEAHQSTNHIYNSYLEYLKYIDSEINAFITRPIEEWKYSDYTYIGFFHHLVENEIIDSSKGYDWCRPSGQPTEEPAWWFKWYYITPETLIKMGIDQTEVSHICLWIKNDTVRITCVLYGVNRTETQKTIVQKIRHFIISNFPDMDDSLKLSYNINNYREKFKYMEHIMSKLETDFRI